MRWIALLILVFLVVACSSKVVRIDNVAEYQQETRVLETAEEKVVEQPVVENNNQETTTTSSNRESNTKSTTSSSSSTTQKVSVNPSEEYSVTSCCNEGRLFIQTGKTRTAYTDSDVSKILIESYSAHCYSLKNYVTQRVYLRYAGEIQDSSYLTFFKGIEYKKIQVDYKTISASFEGCT